MLHPSIAERGGGVLNSRAHDNLRHAPFRPHYSEARSLVLAMP